MRVDFIFLLTYFLIGCFGGASDTEYPSPGTFERKGENFLIQIRFDGDARFYTKSFEDGCHVDESKGEYKFEDSKLKIFGGESRYRNGCGSEWKAWQTMPDAAFPIRKFNSEYFEMYIDNSGTDFPSRWDPYRKM